MTPLVLSSVVVAAALVAAGGWALARRRRARRAEAAMHRRLVSTYPPADEPLDTLPLRAPTGRIAVDDDGLCLALGAEPEDTSLRRVPWSALHRIVAVSGGIVSVHVARVGEVHVPGALARRLWDQTAGANRI